VPQAQVAPRVTHLAKTGDQLTEAGWYWDTMKQEFVKVDAITQTVFKPGILNSSYPEHVAGTVDSLLCRGSTHHRDWGGPFVGPITLQNIIPAASPVAPAAQPAARADEQQAKQLLTMRISYELAGRCFWHLDCKAQRHAPPMQIERDDTAIKQTLLRCTACNLAGWYPHGSVGEVCCAPEPLPAAPLPETKE
jgi:hypothetical protein